MKTISDIKMEYTRKFRKFEERTMVEGRSFRIEIGTKRAKILIEKKGEFRAISWRNGKEHYSFRNTRITLAHIELNLKQNLKGNLFIEVFCTTETDATTTPKNISKQELLECMDILLHYWVDYWNKKNGSTINFFVSSDTWNEKELCKTAFKNNDLEDYNNYLSIFDVESRSYYWSSVKQAYVEEMKKILNLTNQVKEMTQKEPTFKEIGKKDLREAERLFSISAKRFYFENEYFSIVPEGNKVKMLPQAIEWREYQFEDNVVERMLFHIKEEKGLLNLNKPPIYHFKNFVQDKLAEFLNDDVSEGIVSSLDDEIGLGITEEEMVILNKRFETSDKEIFVSHHEKTYSIFRIKSNRYYWFILRFGYGMVKTQSEKVQLFPMKKDELPREISQQIELAIKRKLIPRK